MYKDILIPTDGSDAANQAAEHGFELAEQYSATVHPLHVVELTDPGLSSTYAGIDGGIAGFEQELLPSMEEQGQTMTDDLADRAAAFDLTATTAVWHGRVPVEIVKYADEHGIDLIVMGTHGRSGVERFLLGSVTERVIRTANVPVLVVQAENPVEQSVH